MYELKMTLKSLLQETQETQEKAQQNAGARTRGTQSTCFTSTKLQKNADAEGAACLLTMTSSDKKRLDTEWGLILRYKIFADAIRR